MKLRDSLADNSSILLQAEVSTQQEAVKFGMDLSVKVDVAEPRYYQTVLNSVEQSGPYFVITSGLAMSHGRPEGKVKKTGFALVMPKTPLASNYKDNGPIGTLITMTAVDANTYREVGIMQIVNLFDDEVNFDCLHACRTAQEVLDLIDNTIVVAVQKDTKTSLPMLQVALNNQPMSPAYETACPIVEEVDIIEVGTILYVVEGVRAVRDLKTPYLYKIMLAGAKIVDAGGILSRICFEVNIDWVTIICCADINTTKGALEVAKGLSDNVQTELMDYWIWEQAQEWRDTGIGQVVYCYSRNAQAAGMTRGGADISAIKRLSEIGLKVIVTGGLTLEDLSLFQGVPVHVSIAGRSIHNAASPVGMTCQFKRPTAQPQG